MSFDEKKEYFQKLLTPREREHFSCSSEAQVTEFLLSPRALPSISQPFPEPSPREHQEQHQPRECSETLAVMRKLAETQSRLAEVQGQLTQPLRPHVAKLRTTHALQLSQPLRPHVAKL